MKRYLQIILFVVIGLVIGSVSQAQSLTMYNYSTGTFAWDASAPPKDGAGVNIAGTMTYQVWSKGTVPASTGTKVGGEISALKLAMVFVPYVEQYPGVQAIFRPTAAPNSPQSSAIAWSTDPAVCAGGVTFGILFSPTIDMIKNLKISSP
jgi:hypothetical protein